MADVPAVLAEPLNRAVGNAAVSHQEHAGLPGAGFGFAVAGNTNPKAMPRRVASGRNVGSVNTFDIRLNP